MSSVRAHGICLAAGAALAISAFVSRAAAQEESVAESLFREARDEMKHGDARAACPKFAESYRLDPSNGTLLNWALCEDALGNTATAWTKLRQFIDGAATSDPRVALAKARAARLEALLPRVRLIVPPTAREATVRLDGVELREASLGEPIPVNPGEHVALVTLPSGASSETRFRIRAAEEIGLELTVPESPPNRPVAPDVSASETSLSQPGPRTVELSARAFEVRKLRHTNDAERSIAYVAAGVGVSGLVAAGVFGSFALGERDTFRQHCPGRVCQDQIGLNAARDGARDETVANVAFAVGAVAVIGSALLWWHSGRTAVAISAGRAAAGISVSQVVP